MTAQVARHQPQHQTGRISTHALNKAVRRNQLQSSNEAAQASSRTSLSSSGQSRGLGPQSPGRGSASNKATAAQTMDARPNSSRLGPPSLGRAPNVDSAFAVPESKAGHRQRPAAGFGSATDYGNPIIVAYRRKIAQSFGYRLVNGKRRPLTTPDEILNQYALLEDERQRLPVTNMSKLHTRDILLARRQYLLTQLARSAQLASASRSAKQTAQSDGRPSARPTARSSSTSTASIQSLSDPVHDSTWPAFCKEIESIFLKAVKHHGKVHKRCAYLGEAPCDEWMEIVSRCRGPPSHEVHEWHVQGHPNCSKEGSCRCDAWLQHARELCHNLQRQAETCFVAEQDIQRARSCISALFKTEMMLPWAREYNRKLKAKKYICKDGIQRSITLSREEMNGWREEIKNVIAVAHKHHKSVDAALREFRGRRVWRELGEPEKQYFQRYFKLDPKECQVYEEPSEYLSSGSTHASSFVSHSASSAQTYAWTEMGIPEDQRSAAREELAAIRKERKKKFKMKNWIHNTNANVPEVQEALKANRNIAMPAAIAKTLQHMQAWEKHRKDVVPPKASDNDVASSVSTSSSSSGSRQSGSSSGNGSQTSGYATGSSKSSGAKKSDRGRYDALASVVLDESTSRPGGRSIQEEPPVYEDFEEGEDGDEDDDEFEGDEYYEDDDEDTEALFEELRQSGRGQPTRHGGDRPPMMKQEYDDGYGSMSSATDVTSGDTNSAYKTAGPRIPTGRGRKH